MYSSIPTPDVSISLRLPDIPMPSYRYVPGIHPHPMKHERGHSYLVQEQYEWCETMSWKDDHAWLRGQDLFDLRFYWEAHEIWEGRWKQVSGDRKSLIQGMILASASLLQRHMERHSIARKSWVRAQELFSEPLAKGLHNGIDLPLFIRDMNRELPLGGWPQIQNRW